MRSAKNWKLLLLGATIPLLILAQSFTASVRGVVTDSTKAVVPGAKVTLTEVNRNTKQHAVSDGSGRYVLASVPSGNYRLEIEAAGFVKHMQGPFAMEVQQQATLDAQLEVGSVATNVEVTAAAPLVNFTSASLGQVVENKFILSLPSSTRSAVGLVALAPGVRKGFSTCTSEPPWKRPRKA